MTYLSTMFEKFAEMPPWGWALVIVLLAGGLIAWKLRRGSQKTVWTTKMLALGAICMALSCVLSMIRLFRMPNGGSVTPASMLPLMLFSYVYGAGPGVALGAVYGMMQLLLGGYMLSVPQVLLEYPIAFALIGLAGLFHRSGNMKLGLALGAVIGSFGRYVAATVAGIVFWSDLTQGVWPAIVYSVGYNASYMLPDCIICVVLAVLLGERLVKALRKVA